MVKSVIQWNIIIQKKSDRMRCHVAPSELFNAELKVCPSMRELFEDMRH